jgi:ATP-dependent RNA helicase RhlE
MSDIEKLIKTKIELEALELDDAPPRREPRERLRRDAAEVPNSTLRPAPPRPAPQRAPRDPFFEQPYVAASDASPVWEKSASTPVARALSPNIKPKKKLAALFGAKSAESSPGQQ